VEGIKIDGVASPAERAAIRRHEETGEIANGARRRVVSRDPLRVHKCKGARFDRNGKFRMNYILTCVGQVDLDNFKAIFCQERKRQNEKYGGNAMARTHNVIPGYALEYDIV
jgi:hypothetical protein